MDFPRKYKTAISGKKALLAATAGSFLLWIFFGGANPRTFAPDAAAFVEIDSAGFVLIPNLGRFVSDAMPHLDEIVAFTKKNMDRTIERKDCRRVSGADDLTLHGLATGGSAVAGIIPDAIRLAAKYSDPAEAVSLARDLIVPKHVHFRVSSTSSSGENEAEEPLPTDGQADAEEESQPDQNTDTDTTQKGGTFEITLLGNGYRACFQRFTEVYEPGDIVRIETGALATGVSLDLAIPAANEAASFGATCLYTAPDGSSRPCSCSLEDEQACGAEHVSLAPIVRGAYDDAQRALDGEAIELNVDAEVRLANGFLVVTLGPGRKRAVTPAVSILGDDAFLAHVRRSLKLSSGGTTIVGALRPDVALGHIKGAPYIPVSLQIPFTVGFGDKGLDIQAAVNPEPADIALLQKLILPTTFSEELALSYGDTIGGAGSVMSDPDMRTYLASLEIIMPGFIDEFRDGGPFSPYVLSFLSRHKMPVEIAFLGIDPESNVWRIGMTAPNIPRNEARRLIKEERARETRSRRAAQVSNFAKFLLDRGSLEQQGGLVADEYIRWGCATCEEVLIDKLVASGFDIDRNNFKLNHQMLEVSYKVEGSPPDLETHVEGVIPLGAQQDIRSILWSNNLAAQEYQSTRDLLLSAEWRLQKICNEAARRDVPPPVAAAPGAALTTAAEPSEADRVRKACGFRVTADGDAPVIEEEVQALALAWSELRRRRSKIAADPASLPGDLENVDTKPGEVSRVARRLWNEVRKWRAELEPIDEGDAGRLCQNDPRLRMITNPKSGGIANYDASRRALDLAFTTSDLELMRGQLERRQAELLVADDVGKVRFLFNTSTLGKMPKVPIRGRCLCGVSHPSCGQAGLSDTANVVAVDDEVEKLATFPYPNLTVDLYGRGRAMSVRLRISKEPGDD